MIAFSRRRNLKQLKGLKFWRWDIPLKNEVNYLGLTLDTKMTSLISKYKHQFRSYTFIKKILAPTKTFFSWMAAISKNQNSPPAVSISNEPKTLWSHSMVHPCITREFTLHWRQHRSIYLEGYAAKCNLPYAPWNMSIRFIFQGDNEPKHRNDFRTFHPNLMGSSAKLPCKVRR